MLFRSHRRGELVMLELIKKIWAGPVAVKVSMLFIFLVVFVNLIGNAPETLFAFAIFYCVYRIVRWLEYDE